MLLGAGAVPLVNVLRKPQVSTVELTRHLLGFESASILPTTDLG